MQFSEASFSRRTLVRLNLQCNECRLTGRSTGRYTACRYLGYKILAQIPSICSAGSSVETVGEWRLGQFPKYMI